MEYSSLQNIETEDLGTAGLAELVKQAEADEFRDSTVPISKAKPLVGAFGLGKWQERVEALKSAYASASEFKEITPWGATQIACAEVLYQREHSLLKDAWDRAITCKGITPEGAARIAAVSAITGKSVSDFTEAFKKFNSAWGMEEFTAAHLAVVAVKQSGPGDNKNIVDNLLTRWRQANKAPHIDCLSAGLMASASVMSGLPIGNFIENWKDLWNLSGIDEISTTQLAVTSTVFTNDTSELDCGDFMASWNVAYQVPGIDSRTASDFSVYNNMEKAVLFKSIDQWKEAMKIGDLTSLDAGKVVMGARLTNGDLTPFRQAIASAMSLPRMLPQVAVRLAIAGICKVEDVIFTG